MPDARSVRSFRVLIHGQFARRVRLSPAETDIGGFYTTRWVVADTKENATRKAFQLAKRELEQWGDIRDGLVGIDMKAEDVNAGSWWRWLRGGGKGFAFYADD